MMPRRKPQRDMNEQITTSTGPSGDLRARRLALLIAGLNTALVILFAILQIAGGYDVGLQGFTLVLNAIVYSVLGALIVSRVPRHTIGWLFLLTGFLTAFNIFPFDRLLETYDDPGLLQALFLAASEVIYIPTYLIPLTLVLQFFPDGRLPSPRWRPLTLLTLFTLFAATIGGIIGALEARGVLVVQASDIVSGLISGLTSLSLMVSIFGSLATVVVRFYHSRGVERAQMKWLVYTVLLWVPALVLSVLISNGESEISAFLILSYPTVLAVAISIAILRYRLFDIDIIIRRTLVYSQLTAVLVGVYFGVVLLAQSAFVAITGQESPLAVVISTLLIAALFNPLRRWLQSFIDRRFFRRKYDAEQILARFAQTAREETDLEALMAGLSAVVEETMQPEVISLWMKEQVPR